MKSRIIYINIIKKKQTDFNTNFYKNKNTVLMHFLNNKNLKNVIYEKKNVANKKRILFAQKFVASTNKFNWKKKIKKVNKTFVFIFIRKFFNSFIKCGKKMLSINYFLKIMFFACIRLDKLKKKIKKTKLFLVYFNQILNNILPVFIYTNLMFRGKNTLLPWINKNPKQNKIKVIKICISWAKKSIHKRKEKTIFFKILSELEDIRKNKGETVLTKKNYYLEFYNNRHYYHFLKKRRWV